MRIIKAENLNKTYTTTKALDNASVEIDSNDFTALMGSSGSGKSTLMYVISGMEKADSGTIFFEGSDISKYDENELADLRRLKMGFVFQQPTLLKNLNIIDNIILPTYVENEKNVDSLVSKAKDLMRKTGIEGLEDRSLTQVSGGQLQRVGICRALMGSPSIIFADEPTGALNSKASREIIELLKSINDEGTAILMVTHDPGVAANAKNVLFMKDGQIIDELIFDISMKSDIELKKK